MRCPKCKYIVAEYFKSCPECSHDLTELAELFGPFPEITEEFWDSLYKVLEGKGEVFEQELSENTLFEAEEAASEDIEFNELLEADDSEELDFQEEPEDISQVANEEILDIEPVPEEAEMELGEIELAEEDLAGVLEEVSEEIEVFEEPRASEIIEEENLEVSPEEDEVPELELLTDLEGVEEILPEELTLEETTKEEKEKS
ncbi:hypothetical protein [Thermodesulfatator autotrophicus]|uniref:Uncharacterized protein n=1 Tax=Thermodesulfatator autotrophicus TaxID=1795632 RepID=A0A177E5F3_9BACT|nr:hypothetical protein [Thermodesulfatator autotrophicus]OAG27197.1 hypothetical protein TH606_08290 [Thermodesulfatator autotrophicus]